MQVNLTFGAFAALLLAGIPAFGQNSPHPDPVLQGVMPGPCIAALEGPDYVPGVDANGQAVARADIGADRVPVPGDILVPLPSGPNRGGPARGGRGPGRGGQEPAYLMLGRERIDRLVNPETCPSQPRR